ncbi:MAG: hypothetical protein MRJ96_09955 [Nitrospirales bacterium]|nr:hypothetical protein [Nitrospira sp.]MDR4501760.1 hypothetical protein [Nitrospirales bacterium]
MRTIDCAVPGSFRDPSGHVFVHDQVLYRAVNLVYRDEYDLLNQSGLYDALVKDGLLIPHEEVSSTVDSSPNIYKILKPEAVPFISYPYEWCFSQLQHAALLTLEIQRRALRYGMMLKDASAYNIQFHQGTPVFIDSLSFERYTEGQPWVAYRQFCQHFLAPLALMSAVDIRLNQLSRVHIDGIPLDLTSALLPWSSRLRFGVLSHIHLHAKSQRQFAAERLSDRSRPVSKNALFGLIESLQSTTERLSCPQPESCWSSYYEDNSYTEDDMAEKIVLVGRILDELAPRTMWDLGANTGRFSQLAGEKGINVIAFEGDPGSSEQHYRTCVKRQDAQVLPLVLDLANPSSAIGWAHEERQSLIDRGPTDVVVALALIHHLAIANNIPFEKIAKFLSDIGHHLIIEFVPKHDSQVQRLLASRIDIFSDYTQEHFEQTFGSCFAIERSVKIGDSGRVLYVMKRR